MEWVRPTIKAVNDRIQTSLGDSLGLKIPLQKASIINALSMATAGAIHLLYGNLEWVKKQMIPDSADSVALEWWARLFGIERNPAQTSKLKIKLLGESGSKIPKGTAIKSQVGTVEYQALLDGVVPAEGVLILDFLSQKPGVFECANVGARFNIVNPISGINSKELEVVEVLSYGCNAEGDDSLFRRFRARVRSRGHGGRKDDYIFWAQQTPGVGRVWTFDAIDRPGVVDILAISNDISTPILSKEQLQTLQIKLNAERPVGVKVIVSQVQEKKINFNIKLTQSSLQSRAHIEQHLREYLFESTDPDSIITIERLKFEISKALNSKNFEINSPALDIKLDRSEFATFGGIKWEN